MAKTITFVSGKGGVGKTSLIANVGVALAKNGFKVLLVDADVAMANLSLLLGMQSSPITLHDVLLGESNIQDAIYDGPAGCFFVPSGLSLETYRRVDSERLEAVVNSIEERYDFVLIDAPAGIEKNVMSAIAAAKEALIITTPDSPSLADALKTKLVAQRLGVNPIGVIVNFFRNEKGEIKPKDISKLLELPVFGIVPEDPEVRKSFMQENVAPVILRKPNSPASLAIKRIAEKISGKSMGVILEEKKPGFFSRLFSFRRKK
ncbi:MAG: cell division ATPase MinD [Candidatus Diapherotrites archaeon]|nr:cell division ATPase MinD [Candidatus Diapherotrites archaeon]